MKQLVLALLLGFSLSACAQSNGGAVAAKPDADVPAADLGKIAAGSPEARARRGAGAG